MRELEHQLNERRQAYYDVLRQGRDQGISVGTFARELDLSRTRVGMLLKGGL